MKRDEMLMFIRSPQWGTWHTSRGAVYRSFVRRCADEAGSLAARRREHDDRCAIAVAMRQVGSVFGLTTEHMARKPQLYVCDGDARDWRELMPLTWRSAHGTGEVARSSWSRAKHRLWEFVFGLHRRGQGKNYRGCPRIEW